jgi:hypothetical protein
VTLDRFSVVRRGQLEIADLLAQTLPFTKARRQVAGRNDNPGLRFDPGALWDGS